MVAQNVAPWLIGLAFLLVPVSIARTTVNFFQGLRIVKRISIVVAIGSAVGVIAVVCLVTRFGLLGWLVGRYIAESMLAVAALAMCWRYLRATATLPNAVKPKSLLIEGSAVSSSLLIRSAIDNVPVLSLGWFAIAAVDVGYFGLGSLVAAALLLLPGAMNSLAIAPLVSRLQQAPSSARHLLVRLHLASAAMTVPATLALIVVLPILLRALAPAYLPGTGLLRVLIAVVPLRAATGASGNALLAAGRIAKGLWYNIATLALVLTALALLVPRYGVTGAAISIVIAETASALAFAWGASRYVRDPRAASGGELFGVLRQKILE